MYDFSLFPTLFAKKKQEELDAYTQEQTRQLQLAERDCADAAEAKRAAVNKKYPYKDDGFFSYLKSMAIVYAVLFGIVGMILGPIIAFADKGMPDDILLIILYIIGGVVFGAIGGALASVAGIIPLAGLSCILSPILYFLIYRPSCDRRSNKHSAEYQKINDEYELQLGVMRLPFLADLKVHQDLMQKEIDEYTALFEEQALYMKDHFAENPIVEEISDWLTEKYVAQLRAIKRDESVESIELTFSFTVSKTKITAAKEDFKFADHRMKNLDSDLDKMALSLAVMTNTDLKIVHSGISTELGDKIISITPSHTYLSNPNAPAVRMDIKYLAYNEAFVPVQDWVAPPKPIFDQK